jgi:hypothetical protein
MGHLPGFRTLIVRWLSVIVDAHRQGSSSEARVPSRKLSATDNSTSSLLTSPYRKRTRRRAGPSWSLLFLRPRPMLHLSSFPLMYGCSKNAPGVPVRATFRSSLCAFPAARCARQVVTRSADRTHRRRCGSVRKRRGTRKGQECHFDSAGCSLSSATVGSPDFPGRQGRGRMTHAGRRTQGRRHASVASRAHGGLLGV